MKTILWGKFIALDIYILEKKKDKKSISFYTLGNYKIKSKLKKAQEIKIRIEINAIENRESIEKINETESSFSEKISNIDTCNQAKKKRRENKLPTSEMKKGPSLLVPCILKG